MRPEYKDVTLRMLLGHTGGVQPNINTNQVPAGTLTAQRANIARIATQAAPSAAVGTYNYSNVGYMIAANMVERAMGITWEQVMQQKLLTPLSITAFGWGPAPVANNPIGHQRNGTTWQEWPNSDNPPFLSSAGRSHWSMEAWGKVLQDIMKADQGQSPLVPQNVARVNTTSQSSANYGSGWQMASGSWAQGRAVQHDGSNNLNYARMQVALDRGVAVMAVTNSHDPNSTRSNNAMATLTERLWAYYAANSN
jgi:CubicO group peptidase (beta-lactamase class C family)